MAEFFSKLNYHFKDHDLFCIIKRIDKDQDGSICYSDFVEFILPIKPYTRLSLNSVLNKSNNEIRTSPMKSKPIIQNTNLFPAHFKCYSCNVAEEKNIGTKKTWQSNEIEPNDNNRSNKLELNDNNQSHKMEPTANNRSNKLEPTHYNISNKFEPTENIRSDKISFYSKEEKQNSFYSKENPQDFQKNYKTSSLSKENPQKKPNGAEIQHTYTNLTYTQSNRDSFRTPTKNSFAPDTNRNAYFSTKPLQNNKIQNNDTAKDFKVQKEVYKNIEKKEEISTKKYYSKSFMGQTTTGSNDFQKDLQMHPSKKEEMKLIPSKSFATQTGSNDFQKDFPSKKEEMKPIPVKTIIKEEIKIQLKDLFYLDKSIRLYMEELYEDFDLDLVEIYRFFDINNKVKIDAKCLELKLKEYEIFISKFEIYCFVEKYDSENKGFLK